MMKLSILAPAAMLCLLIACSKGGDGPNDPDNPDGGQLPVPSTIPLPTVNGENTFNLGPNADYVNVMGTLPGQLPTYPDLTKKPGKLIGYVTDLSGRPIEGAYIGVRSSAIGGSYSYSSGQTNSKGYYEMEVPFGVVHFWAAGALLNYAGGTAPMGLRSIGTQELGTFSGSEGAVKHFVLLSYGIANPGDVQGRPWYSNNYYGGSIYLNYEVSDPDDIFRSEGALAPDDEIVIKLTPQDNFLYGEQRTFIINKKVGTLSCNINNIPVGKYKIEAKLKDGSELRMRSIGTVHHPIFGLHPVDVYTTSFVTFIPSSPNVSSPIPNRGDWNQVNVNVRLRN